MIILKIPEGYFPLVENSGLAVSSPSFFPPNIWKILCHFLITSMVFRGNLKCHSNCFSPKEKVLVFSCFLQDFFFFVFSFQNFDHNMYGFLWVYFVWGHSAWICKFVSFAKFGNFSDIIMSLNTFSDPPFILFFQDSNVNMRSFHYSLTSPWDSVNFFQSIFSLLFRLHNCCSVFQFTYSSVSSILLLSLCI